MKKTLLTAVIICVAVFSVFAEASQPYYVEGDTFFSIKAGANAPFFEYYPFKTGSEKVLFGFKKDTGTGLSIGFDASLAYEVFTKPNLAFGAEIGYTAYSSRDGQTFSVIPLQAKATYLPYQSEKFDVKLNAGLGAAVVKFGNSQICPFASISVNPTYFFSENWGVGISAGVSAVAEIYTSSNEEQHDKTCIAVAAPVVISVTYRH